jgi:hypothetical protein
VTWGEGAVQLLVLCRQGVGDGAAARALGQMSVERGGVGCV